LGSAGRLGADPRDSAAWAAALSRVSLSRSPSLSIPVGAGGVAGRLCSGDGIDGREAEDVADNIGGHPGKSGGARAA
jgi:hypothetical protein